MLVRKVEIVSSTKEAEIDVSTVAIRSALQLA